MRLQLNGAWLLALLGALGVQAAAVAAHAQTPSEPARYLLAASAGVPLRLTMTSELGQTRFAPAYTDALVGYVPAGQKGYGHGFGLGAALNLGRDGGYTAPLYAAQQLVLMPAYLGHYELSGDLLALAHLGVPIVVHGGPSAGLELGMLLDYRILAGAGIFAQLDVDAYAGAQSRMNVIASLALGVLLDYEVLP